MNGASVRDICVRSWSALNQELFEESWNPALSRFRSTFAYRGLCDIGYDLGSDGQVSEEREIGLRVSNLDRAGRSSSAQCFPVLLTQTVQSRPQAESPQAMTELVRVRFWTQGVERNLLLGGPMLAVERVSRSSPYCNQAVTSSGYDLDSRVQRRKEAL